MSMQSADTTGEEDRGVQRMPQVIRWVVGVGLATLLGGGLYLIAVRGEALLLDLSRLAAYCF